jgi:hypothetical protein
MASVFHDLVKKKMSAFRGKYPPFHSAHEGLALILEEVEELKDEVFKRRHVDDPLKFLNELVDIAAYCEIFAEDARTWQEGRNHREEPR